MPAGNLNFRLKKLEKCLNKRQTLYFLISETTDVFASASDKDVFQTPDEAYNVVYNKAQKLNVAYVAGDLMLDTEGSLQGSHVGYRLMCPATPMTRLVSESFEGSFVHVFDEFGCAYESLCYPEKSPCELLDILRRREEEWVFGQTQCKSVSEWKVQTPRRSDLDILVQRYRDAGYEV